MNVEIAERLAKRRRGAGYSQESLAEKLGVSRQAVSKWERSESSPDTDNLIALAQLYGVSLDELLYVDESLKEDIAFEAADRAAAHKSQDESQAYSETKAAETPFETHNAAASGEADKTKKQGAKIGFDGIHINDGDDYVHVSWKDGVHIKDSRENDEVHVGWSGVNVKEREFTPDFDDIASEMEDATDDWNTGPVVINGEAFDSWQDAHEQFGHGYWGSPTSYTVKGEHFDSLKDARAKYGPEVGKSIPVKKHYAAKSWLKFPFPLLAIIAYILLGVFFNVWGIGLFVFFTVPVYYMAVHAIATKKPASFFAGLYPIAAIAWFLWMAFVLQQPHPAWVVFLTIPVAEWLIHSVSRAYRRRKNEDEVIEAEVDA